MQSESIVESICSSLKKTYTTDRHQLKKDALEILIKLRLCLPRTKAQRDIVIKKVIEEYRRRHPKSSSHKVSDKTKARRLKKGRERPPVIYRHENKQNIAFTVPFD